MRPKSTTTTSANEPQVSVPMGSALHKALSMAARAVADRLVKEQQNDIHQPRGEERVRSAIEDRDFKV